VLGSGCAVAACAIVLTLAAPVAAGNRPPPWSGGGTRVTLFEAEASRVATSFAGGRVSVECAAPATWRSLAAEHGFDRALTWALTPLRWDPATGSSAPLRYSTFSPRACRLADAFLVKPTERGARLCRHGTTRVWRTLTAGRNGEAVVRKVRVVRPLLGECDNWAAKLLAVHVLAHESMHLARVVDEAEAECLAVQIDALVAARLGASTTFARSLAREYWTYYYRSQDRRYQSRDCRDGGDLDLFRSRRGWPSPVTYPSDPASTIARFVDLHAGGRSASSP
jgi:hypothetical protein